MYDRMHKASYDKIRKDYQEANLPAWEDLTEDQMKKVIELNEKLWNGLNREVDQIIQSGI